jgi:hypothetical protein
VDLYLSGDRPWANAAQFQWTGSQHSLEIDASMLGFVSPVDVAGTLAISHRAADLGIPTVFKTPYDPDVGRYLSAVGFFDLLPADSKVQGSMPDAPAKRGYGAMLPVTRLTSTNQKIVCDTLGSMITDYYRKFFPRVDAGLPVFRACGELISNAVEHGDSHIGAFVAAQTHTGATTGGIPRMEFAVCDNGVGVRGSLRRNPKFEALADDAPALRAALRRGVSGAGDHRGDGLYHVVRDTTVRGDVTFTMRSGSAEILVTSIHRRVPSVRSDRTEGTWAWLTHQVQDPAQTVLQSGQ